MSRPLYVERNGDLPDKKTTFYDDYYSGFIQWFVESNAEFKHLVRPRKYWRIPTLYDANIRYSKTSEKHQRYMKLKKAGRLSGRRKAQAKKAG